MTASRASIFRHALICVTAAVALTPRSALAWGATGHEWVSGIAIEALPDELPAFVRTPEAGVKIALLGRELDRSKGAGATHDRERDPGHYINPDDTGSVFGVPLDGLPETREAYDTALRANGMTQYKAGYLPYSIVDGWQQLRKDFAYWRADVVAAKTAVDAADRTWFDADRQLREMLIIRDLGIWSHYVGDASQPLHVSIHFNGWGNFPNPNGFTNSQKLHAHFEGEFVRDNLDRAAVKQAVAPYKDCGCKIEERTRTFLLETQAMVVPLYELEKQHGFSKGNAEGIAFTVARLAAGSSALRDMIVDAWRASANMGVGYPMVNVREVEAGRRVLTRKDFGGD
jgi:hypothetical protein